MKNRLFKERGITLIALIITVIVMLILVGVTITVALNGGLFETATKAATETQKETERERLTEIALASYNASEGKITNADDLANKIKNNLGFNKDTEKSTDSKLVVQGTKGLWQIDLNSVQVEPYTAGDTYTFTIGELGRKGLLGTDTSGGTLILASSFWRDGVSDDLKKSTFLESGDTPSFSFKMTCSNPKYSNWNVLGSSPTENCFGFYSFKDEDDNNDYVFFLFMDNDTEVTNDNYIPYADISFTISK